MKRLYALFCLLFILSSVAGCAHRTTPTDAMARFCERYPLPAGCVYYSDAAPYEKHHLSESRFDLLYARPDGDSDREDIQDYALFFGTSLTDVREMGIFRCPDRDAAFEVADMLRRRIEVIRAMPLADTSRTDDAAIELYGTTVVYTVLDDNAAAIRTLARILS